MAAATMSWDDGKHMRVNRVQITYEDVINSIEAEYDGDQNPKRHGTPGKKSDGVSLSPDEYITDVTGYYKTTGAEDAIAALAFKTNKTEYGPYGNKTRNQFSIHAPKDNQIAGFQGISSNVLNSIDVHFAPLPSSLSQANKVDAQGGKGGTSWDDGAHDHVRRVYVGQGDSGVTYVKFEYEKNGNKETREHGKKTLLGAEVFEVDPDDHITSVEVQSDRIFGQDTDVITCLIFKTSKGKTSPPFGLEGSQKYELKDKKFQNVSKEGLKVGKDSKVKELKEAFKELTKWWKESLASENVDDVKISNRLADTPCVVVTSKFGWSANMERIMQSQTLSDANKQAYMRGKRVLEINPRHPIIKELKERVASDPEDESVKETAQLMYQTALIESGFILNDPKDFAGRIYNSVKSSLKISPDAVAEEEVEAEETETSEEATETKSDDVAGGLNIEAEPVEQETPTKDEL